MPHTVLESISYFIFYHIIAEINEFDIEYVKETVEDSIRKIK